MPASFRSAPPTPSAIFGVPCTRGDNATAPIPSTNSRRVITLFSILHPRCGASFSLPRRHSCRRLVSRSNVRRHECRRCKLKLAPQACLLFLHPLPLILLILLPQRRILRRRINLARFILPG